MNLKNKILLFSTFIIFHIPINAKPLSIVIDAGHGGSNKGVIFQNLVEKNLNLKIALRLQKLFSKHGNISVAMTRTDDTNISLSDRVTFIEKINPDFFITIHFNSQVFLTKSRGFEIYYPADDFSEKPEQYLSRFHKNNRSFAIGNFFKKQYFKANLHNTWQLPFNRFTSKKIMLLQNTTKPGLLLEIAYLTSPEDRACISNEQFFVDMVWFLYDTILEYTKQQKG